MTTQAIPPRKLTKINPKQLKTIRGYTFLVILGLMFLTPFYWMVATALKTEAQLFELPPAWIPDPLAFENFVQVFKEVPFGNFIINSATLVAWNVVGQVLSTMLVAYGFSRFRFPGRDALVMVLLATLMIPKQVTLVPQFILFAKLGWVNTYLPLILPSFGGSPYLIFLVRQYMMSIPFDLDEAATIDGATCLDRRADPRLARRVLRSFRRRTCCRLPA